MCLSGDPLPLSVSETVSLPTQPSLGALELFPLGGDGFSSPSSVYAGRAQLASDASGGTNQIRINMDDRYTQVLSYLSIGVTAGAADIDARMELNVTGDELIRINITTTFRQLSGLTASNQALWIPPPVALTRIGDNLPSFRCIVDNTDGETLNVGIRLYNFDREARHRVPLHILFGFLARSSQVVS